MSHGELPWKVDGYRNSELSSTNYKRQQSVREATRHAWAGYKKYAWGKDELQPVTQSSNLRWGDWAITLVDSLDTLKIMELEDEYAEAKEFVRSIRFDRSPAGYKVQFFEMTIRALGGLLGAYELDRDPMLLEKARQVGDSLAYAFDTATGLPTVNVDVNSKSKEYSSRICIAEAGTLQLEFKKLGQVTGDNKYTKYAERANEAIENGERKYKGLYPAFIDSDTGKFDSSAELSVGAMSDSFYEYHLKQHILHGGKEPKFMKRYITSVETVKEKLVKKSESGFTFIGKLVASESGFSDEMEHLACFYPGLLALGAKVLDRPQDLVLAEELARTCYTSYTMTPTGLGPERFGFKTKEQVNEYNKYVYPGSTRVFNDDGMGGVDSRYILRPETLETLFILYRVTGDPKYQEWGWNIFLAIEKHAKVEAGYAGVQDVYSESSTSNHIDAMESFFLAETLKYLYLLFSPTDVISLDEYVFNTEAHPFRIIK
ncbi:hypothetical protein IW146_003447 [Coemansia sp. RSA 922]|nr:hypothetical protein GGH13_001770 [Coemansia sp. S155-1]KAJ2113966.1 hypothetical protein IW146_003447 [Coemansia sp. RSA 922]